MLLYIRGSVQFGTITISTVSHSKWKIVFRATFLIFMYFKHLLCTCMKLNAKKTPMSKTKFLFTINAKSISNAYIRVKDLHKHDINWIEHGMRKKSHQRILYYFAKELRECSRVKISLAYSNMTSDSNENHLIW